MEEKKYPIYVFEIYWIQDGKKWRECDNMLPEDRTWNSTSFERMFRECLEKKKAFTKLI